MGCPAIEPFNLVSRVNTVNGSDQRWVDKYAHPFQELGTMEREYHVKLRDDARLLSPHSVAFVSTVYLSASHQPWNIFKSACPLSCPAWKGWCAWWTTSW